MTTLGQRIKDRRTELGLSVDELAARLNKNRSTVYRYENGEIEELPIGTLEPLARALGTSPAALMGWDTTKVSFIKNIIPLDPVMVPLVGRIAAGTPILAEQNIDGYENLAGGIHADFCVEVHGDSMIGANIHNGDIVFIRQQNDVENGEIAAVLIDDSATLKRFYHDGDTVTLIAENPKYPPMVFHNGDCEKFEILGKAVALQTLIK